MFEIGFVSKCGGVVVCFVLVSASVLYCHWWILMRVVIVSICSVEVYSRTILYEI